MANGEGVITETKNLDNGRVELHVEINGETVVVTPLQPDPRFTVGARVKVHHVHGSDAAVSYIP